MICSTMTTAIEQVNQQTARCVEERGTRPKQLPPYHVILCDDDDHTYTYVIDMLANLSAKVTERVAAFTGNVLDAHGVDGLINGAADTAMDLGAMMGRPQTGRIRNYVLFAAGGAVVIVSAIVFGEDLVRVKDAVLGLVGTP